MAHLHATGCCREHPTAGVRHRPHATVRFIALQTSYGLVGDGELEGGIVVVVGEAVVVGEYVAGGVVVVGDVVVVGEYVAGGFVVVVMHELAGIDSNGSIVV